MKRGIRIKVGVFGLAVCALGMLIWARLMLVARPPRVAMAEPTPAQIPPSDVRAQSAIGYVDPAHRDSLKPEAPRGSADLQPAQPR
jgi:hypothetical protein